LRFDKLLLTLFCVFSVFTPLSNAWGVRPIYSFYSLEAGGWAEGNLDGMFDEARFHAPLGLAVNSDATRLYVADSGNVRIRVVDLADKNTVSTLAGSTIGWQDGPVTQALFNFPTGLLLLSDTRLLVNDWGNHRLRLIDLSSQSVTTIAGNGGGGMEEGDAMKLPLDGVWAMAYQAKENALYLSRPDYGAVQKLDLGTQQLTTVFKNLPACPHPAALCFFNNKLIVADQALSQVSEMDETKSAGITLTPIGAGQTILSLCASGKYLYALEANPAPPLMRLLPNPGPVSIVTTWGLPINPTQFLPLMGLGSGLPGGLTADPHNERRFFVSNTHYCVISSVRDLFFNELLASGAPNSNGMTDFEYPETKPPHTFRILLAGDSLTFFTTEEDHLQLNQGFSNRMQIMAKRLELELNTEAALRDIPMNFEVLAMSKIIWEPLLVWTYHILPPLAKKYDVDLVVLAMSAGFGNNLMAYYQRPMGSDGVPVSMADAKYLSKPYREKIPDGTPRKLFDLCLTKKWVTISSKGDEINFSVPGSFLYDPEARSYLVDMMGKPMGLLNNKLAQMHTSAGAPVKFRVFLQPTNDVPMITFWKEVYKHENLPWGDLTPQFDALSTAYFPLTEMNGGGHYNANGHILFGKIWANKLIGMGLIPWETPADHSTR
jgi:hypothetical protein